MFGLWLRLTCARIEISNRGMVDVECCGPVWGSLLGSFEFIWRNRINNQKWLDRYCWISHSANWKESSSGSYSQLGSSSFYRLRFKNSFYLIHCKSSQRYWTPSNELMVSSHGNNQPSQYYCTDIPRGDNTDFQSWLKRFQQANVGYQWSEGCV